MTNREKLMKTLESMSDEELALFISDNISLESCNFCIHHDLKSCSDINSTCVWNIKTWLGKEIKEE